MSLGEPAGTRLFLIRHGEANAFTEQFIGGHDTCTGLSDLGRRQAAALRDRLTRTNEFGTVDVLYASLMERSAETARIIAPALGDLPVVQDCGVCEIHPGDADGLTWTDFRARYLPEGPADDDSHFADVHTRWAPGGESWAEFAVRAGTRLVELGRQHAGQTIVVGCHGGVIESSFIALGRQPLRHLFTGYIENTSITEWFLAATKASAVGGGGRSAPDWELQRFNDTAHLATL